VTAAWSSSSDQRETVLVVDDEPTLRMVVAEVLVDSGFAAIEAADGAEALAVLRTPARVDLLITDISLPGGMNGMQVAEAGLAIRPDLKVLFITGYAENTVARAGFRGTNVKVLTKPFSVDALGAKIRDIIDG